MPKIAIQILYTGGWRWMADIVLPVAEMYCDKHGYQLKAIEYPEPCPSDFGYNKLRQIQNRFNEGMDIVWGLDLDTLITNHEYRVENFLDDSHDFFICKDANGVNGGSFIIKNTEWSKYFIDWLLKQRGRDKMYCEQDAIMAYMEEYEVSPICVLPHPSINSIMYKLYPEFPDYISREDLGDWKEGNFVLHLPGVGLEKRIEILKNTKITL